MRVIRPIFSRLKRFISLYHPRTLRRKGWVWSIGLVLATALLIIIGLGIFWSIEPDTFDVRSKALELVKGDEQQLQPGVATTTAVIIVAEKLLNKHGGYLSNDVMPPGILLDNIPSWEFGVVTELRDTARALRNDFSRAQTQSIEDQDLMMADAQFHFDAHSWILPSSEEEYRKGIDALLRYRKRLLDGSPGSARFFVRADNLNFYLSTVEKRLGSFAQRLSRNVQQLQFEDDPEQISPIQESLMRSGELQARTPWRQIDDVFFEARGYVWALLHTLKGIEFDFQDVLKGKNGLGQLHRIIHKLEQTQQSVWSPLILNNSGFGMFTNHSLIMASYISRANAAIIDMRILLQEG